MANKRRAKKIRPPYRKYVYRSSFVEGKAESELDEENDEKSVVPSGFSSPQDFSMKTNGNIRSVYVLTEKQADLGKVWPMLQFEKVDVLFWCLHSTSEEYKHKMELLEEQKRMQLQQLQNHNLTLPVEIIVHILEILLYQNRLKPKFLRLLKLFYAITLPLIYRRPNLNGNNFFQFVETILGKNNIGNYIRDLDLSSVNQLGKNAFVAKLLKRSRPFLEAFTAPQTSFGLGPLIALRGCEHLKILDLRLVSETLNLEELFYSIRDLKQLTHLLFPRSSLEIENYNAIKWPPKLEFLRVSGGISDDFLIHSDFPTSIRHMEFAHCPKVAHSGFQHLLSKVGTNLKSLRIQFPMPGLQANSLDSVFINCPNLMTLEVTVDYLSRSFFDDDLLPTLPYKRPLRKLFISSSGMLGTNDKVDPVDLALALSEERLPMLRFVRCTAKLGWDSNSEYVSFIALELEEREGGLYIGY